MGDKTIKQSMREFFSFAWVKSIKLPSIRKKKQPEPKRYSHSFSYRFQEKPSWWRRNKKLIQASTIVLLFVGFMSWIIMDFIVTGQSGSSVGEVVNLYITESTDKDGWTDTDYYVEVVYDMGYDTFSLTSGEWRSVKVGDTCTVLYVVGGYSNLVWAYDLDF